MELLTSESNTEDHYAKEAPSLVQASQFLCAGTTGIKVRLQENLSRNAVAARFAALVGEPGGKQGRLGFHGRETLIPEYHREAGHICQPFAERPRFAGLLSFVAAEMNRQAENNLADRLFFGQLLKVGCVLLLALTRVCGQWRGNHAVGIADSQADANMAVINAKKPRPAAHKYFSR